MSDVNIPALRAALKDAEDAHHKVEAECKKLEAQGIYSWTKRAEVKRLEKVMVYARHALEQAKTGGDAA